MCIKKVIKDSQIDKEVGEPQEARALWREGSLREGTKHMILKRKRVRVIKEDVRNSTLLHREEEVKDQSYPQPVKEEVVNLEVEGVREEETQKEHLFKCTTLMEVRI